MVNNAQRVGVLEVRERQGSGQDRVSIARLEAKEVWPEEEETAIPGREIGSGTENQVQERRQNAQARSRAWYKVWGMMLGEACAWKLTRAGFPSVAQRGGMRRGTSTRHGEYGVQVWTR